MPSTENGKRKICLLRLIVIFLLVIIDDGTSIPQSCQIKHIGYHDRNIIEATCETVRFVTS